MEPEPQTSAARRECALPPPKKPRKKSVKLTPSQRKEAGEGKLNKHWRTYFLQALAETSNVKRSATKARISQSRAYKARREDPAFAARWRAALLEGYEHLEMEVLGYLRSTRTSRKFDVPSAIRLLTLHRDTIAQERARTAPYDRQMVLESIDATIDRMREQRTANTGLLATTSSGSESDDKA
jgi:hypothetical protein